jgi:hypothetical protein
VIRVALENGDVEGEEDLQPEEDSEGDVDDGISATRRKTVIND